MAQINLPVCPQCGTALAPGQRFCSNCGASADAGFSAPTSAASNSDAYARSSDAGPGAGAAPPPPPPESLYTQPAQQYTYYPPQPQAVREAAPAQQNYTPQSYTPAVPAAPDYAKPQKDSTKGVLGQIGCGMLLIILLAVVACGGLSYGAYYFITHSVKATSNSPTYSSSSSSTSGNGTVTTAAATSQNIAQQVTYASDVITIKSVQEGAGTSSTFADDSSVTDAPVVVRLNIHESNPTTSTLYMNYSNGAHLVLPDKSTAQFITAKVNGSMGQGVSQDNWLDYQLSSHVAIDQLTLQLGTADEAQMNVPLTGKADLSAYAMKTIKPNTTFQYAGMNWTLTTVTSSLSSGGQQAKSGQRYIVASLNLSNPSADTFYYNASGITRLQGGSVTNAPSDESGPTVIAAGATNQAETVIFLTPQNASTLTLIMLAQTDVTPAVSEYKTTFQM
jgi:hypothetical protein